MTPSDRLMETEIVIGTTSESHRNSYGMRIGNDRERRDERAQGFVQHIAGGEGVGDGYYGIGDCDVVGI